MSYNWAICWDIVQSSALETEWSIVIMTESGQSSLRVIPNHSANFGLHPIRLFPSQLMHMYAAACIPWRMVARNGSLVVVALCMVDGSLACIAWWMVVQMVSLMV